MRIQKILFALALSVSSFNVFAEGDYEAGKLAANTCAGCHGIPYYNNIYPTYHVPRIGGQNKEYLVVALKEYQSGARAHSTMNSQAHALSDQEIEDIAVYLAAQTKK
jgi:cytochrome c553